jgi:hypothetical protein
VLPAEPGAAAADGWRSLAGFGSGELTVAPGEIDDIVYGR